MSLRIPAPIVACLASLLVFGRNREFHGSLGTRSVRLFGIKAWRADLRPNGGAA
ncbi:MAG: hypothetical protein WBM40_13785 [Thiohalocapsa sp.]